MNPSNLKITDFTYTLPEEKIAFHPLEKRDESKLLVYQNNQITDDNFKNLPNLLNAGDLLVFNNTRVIHARILFAKETGSRIEIMCLEPTQPNEPALSFAQTQTCTWLTLVGNNKKWKEGTLTKQIPYLGSTINLTAKRLEKQGDSFLIKFSWDIEIDFATVIELAGLLPLPPYITRDAEEEDEERYQTVYAKHNGSVAAPTAGLHFTTEVMQSLVQQKIKTDFVTLHVGAGTFKPVKAETMNDHQMHEERIYVNKSFIENLVKTTGKIIAVGTTSLRTLESLYWFGLNLHLNKNNWNEINELSVSQWEPYNLSSTFLIEPNLAFNTILDWLKQKNLNTLTGYTKIIIAPPYKLKVASALITNFHQPQSTLLLLVSAVVGNNWKEIYNHALNNNYRFLSYGDSSILFAN